MGAGKENVQVSVVGATKPRSQSQAEQESPNPMGRGPRIHGQGIEPRHLLIGIALARVEPHLDAAATPLTVPADLVGVTPDALTQGHRRGEVELESAADGLSGTLVRSCRRREDRHRHSSPGYPEILTQPQFFKRPLSKPFLNLPPAWPSPEVQFQPLCQLVLQVWEVRQSCHQLSQSSLHRGTFRKRSFRQIWFTWVGGGRGKAPLSQAGGSHRLD